MQASPSGSAVVAAHMQLLPVRPTVKTPAQAVTGDVYMTPVCNGAEPRMTVAALSTLDGAESQLR
jgi:hypothetical protein